MDRVFSFLLVFCRTITILINYIYFLTYDLLNRPFVLILSYLAEIGLIILRFDIFPRFQGNYTNYANFKRCFPQGFKVYRTLFGIIKKCSQLVQRTYSVLILTVLYSLSFYMGHCNLMKTSSGHSSCFLFYQSTKSEASC